MKVVSRVQNFIKRPALLVLAGLILAGGSVFTVLPAAALSSPSLVYPFATNDPSQYRWVDQGWDLQAGSGAAVYAIAAGTLHVYNPNPGGFGNDYPTETLDNQIGGPTNDIYYGHVHILPGLVNQHVRVGQEIAVTNTFNGQNGSAAPAGWLEIGFAQPGNDVPVGQGAWPTAAGTAMHNILINAPGAVSPPPKVPPVTHPKPAPAPTPPKTTHPTGTGTTGTQTASQSPAPASESLATTMTAAPGSNTIAQAQNLPTAVAPASLVNTGPGSVIAVFTLAVLGGTFGFRRYLRFKTN